MEMWRDGTLETSLLVCVSDPNISDPQSIAVVRKIISSHLCSLEIDSTCAACINSSAWDECQRYSREIEDLRRLDS